MWYKAKTWACAACCTPTFRPRQAVLFVCRAPFALWHEMIEKQQYLKRRKAFALSILVFATLVFAYTLTQPPTFWFRLLKAGAEAAMVGGLADWFAVVALFRHPLGLPIPHTALIPRKKDQLGAGLAGFVERNFLAPEVVAQKLRSLDLVMVAARWIGHRSNA